jgi:hypothetical protein
VSDDPKLRRIGGIEIRGVQKAAPRRRAEDVTELLQAVDAESDPARGLARCLFVLFKVAVLYDLDNAAVGPPLDRTLKQMKGFLDRDGVLSVQRRLDGIYVNNVLVPRDVGLEELYPFLQSVFERLQVHEMAFLRGADDPALRQLLDHFQKVMRGTGEVSDYRWSKVHIRTLSDEKARESRRERERVVSRYALVCVRVTEVLNSFSQGKAPSFAPLKAALTGALEIAPLAEPILIACFPRSRDKPYPREHATNCSLIVGLMTKRLGCSRKALLSAAMAGALHDLGEALPDAPGSGDRWRRALRLLLQVPGQTSELASRLSAIRECAIGTPAVEKPLALSRLISLAHAFDLLITGSATRPPLTMEQAVRVLSGEAGRRYGADAFALLCHTIGFMPPGSILQLASGEMAVVMNVPSDARKWLQPVVRLVDVNGVPGNLIDLSAPDATARQTMRSLFPSEVGWNPVLAML